MYYRASLITETFKKTRWNIRIFPCNRDSLTSIKPEHVLTHRSYYLALLGVFLFIFMIVFAFKCLKNLKMFLCERYFPVSPILKVTKNPRNSIAAFEAPLTVRRVNSIGKTDRAAGAHARQSLGQVTVCLGQVGRLKGFSIDITQYLWASESAGFTELELSNSLMPYRCGLFYK